MKPKTVKPEDFVARDDIELAGGYEVQVAVERDDCLGAPWDECDGHGIVSEWTRRDKQPGEWVLCEDRGSRRFYDARESMTVARRDGWDAQPFGVGTAGERAARAVRRDFEYLRAWCTDDWAYMIVTVTLSRKGEEVARDSLGAVESYRDYWRDVAADMANELVLADRDVRKRAAIAARFERCESREWAARDVVTV